VADLARARLTTARAGTDEPTMKVRDAIGPPPAALRALLGLLVAGLFAVTAGVEAQGLCQAVVLLGAALCLGRALLVRAERAGWLLIGLGFASWGAGDLYFLLALDHLADVPMPSAADAGYLALVPLAVGGVLLLARSSGVRPTGTVWLDGLIAGLSGAALSAAVVLDDVTAAAAGGPALEVVYKLAYPAGDLVLLGVVVAAVALNDWRLDRRWALLAGGVVAFWVADSAHLVNPGGQTPFDAGWAVASLLVGWAAWEPAAAAPAAGRAPYARPVVPPLVFAALSAILLGGAGFLGVHPAAGALAAVSQACVIARLLATMRADRRRVAAEAEALRERRELRERLERSQRLETVGQLAGGVAHDFNNLLAVILNYVEFVRDELSPASPAHADADQIRAAAERGARLTRQLLLFAQRKATQAEVLDLDEVVGATHAMLGRTLGGDIEMRVVARDETWLVEIDRGNLEQVIVNLAINARDAVGPNGRIALATSNADLGPAEAEGLEVTPGRYVRLEVADDGCGMEPDLLARAFEPFVTTKAPGEGTGLGLATVYGIVRQAGGGIRARSQPGRGTTFEVYVPAAATPGAGAAQVRVRGAARGVGERLLVVEDEPPLRAVLERILRGAGYDVTGAGSGEEALRARDDSEAPFDLLITDMVMPGMTGLEVAERLRARDPGRPVIFMSGYSSELIERRTGPAAGPLLIKPFTPEALLAQVRDALDGANVVAAA
jgi:signal transduction histidine kinase